METLLALALGLLVGLIVGAVGMGYWTIRVYARAVKRELNAGTIDRGIAERLADLRNA